MPISSTSQNYTGRLVDVSLLNFSQNQTVEELTSDTKSVSISFKPVSRYCSGIQKLIQRYTVYLLTELGSQSEDPDFGTLFITQLKNRQNNVSQIDVEHFFNVANLKIMNAFKEYQKENVDIPDDEILNSASLNSFEVNGDSVYIKIQLVVLSGDNTTFLVPLPI